MFYYRIFNEAKFKRDHLTPEHLAACLNFSLSHYLKYTCHYVTSLLSSFLTY
jgi:hypothetical protein